MAQRNRPLGPLPMEAGERDLLITIEQLTDTSGSTGFPVEQWSTLTTLYAGRYDERGIEQFWSSQFSASMIVRWETAYRADCDPDLVNVPKTRRIRYGGRIYEVMDASQIGRREGIEFITRARTQLT